MSMAETQIFFVTESFSPCVITFPYVRRLVKKTQK